jgi:serine O-acetyltransferase
VTHISALNALTRSILTSYADEGGINHVGGPNLPSRKNVESILCQVETLCFPGFSFEENLTADSIEYVTGHKVVRLFEAVKEQVHKNLVWDRREGGQPVGETAVESEARDFAWGFLEFVPKLRRMLSLDVSALLEGDPAARSRDEIILSYPGVQAVLVHRVAHWFWSHGARLIARMMSEQCHAKTGIDIHPGAQIGKSFHIDHGTGVVLGETCVIGDHVKVYQGVSLGALSVSRRLQDQKRHPTIEDHVTIYAGATILGGNTVVGHHSVVGGNVWLIKSVVPYSVVENDPRVRVRPKQLGDDWYEI